MSTPDDLESDSPQLLVAHKKIPLISGVFSLFGLMIVLITNNPGSGGPMVILFFLALLFIFFVSFAGILIQFVARIFKLADFSTSRLLYTSVIIAAGCIFLVGLQTLRQLQSIDVILTLLFEVVLNFYLLRRF